MRLEQEFQRQLQLPVAQPGGSDLSESWGAQYSVRRTELRRIEQVKHFHAELQPIFLAGAELRGFEEREIEIIDSLHPQCRVRARLVPEGECDRLGEARRVEPLRQPLFCVSGKFLGATRNYVGP